MNSKQLLEAAARAAGYELRLLEDGSIIVDSRRWNPLHDDGDMFRLAIDLDISFRQQPGAVFADYPHFDPETFNLRKTIGEPVMGALDAAEQRILQRTAARRAGVRAAAACDPHQKGDGHGQ